MPRNIILWQGPWLLRWGFAVIVAMVLTWLVAMFVMPIVDDGAWRFALTLAFFFAALFALGNRRG